MKYQPKIIKRVTIPVLKMKLNRPYYLKFLEAIHVGEKLEKSKYDTPANVVQVMDFETGEVCLVICYKVLQSEIEKNYPNEAYISKSFEIIAQRHPDPNVKYRLYTISEIFEPSPEDFNPVDLKPEGEPPDDEDFEYGPDEGEDPTDSLDTDLSDNDESSDLSGGDMPQVSVRNTKGKKGKRVNA